jgi:sugar phosphate isomerase/epimerase
MKIGLCSSADQADLAAKAGFNYLEGNVQTLLKAEASEADFAPGLKATQSASLPTLAANCFLPGSLKCVGPDLDIDRVVRYAGTAFRRARLVGIKFVVFGSGAARQIPEGFDVATTKKQFLDVLQRIAPLAEEHNVTVVIEPLASKECNFITSLADGAFFVEAVNHPNIRLLADFYHMSCDEESPGEIVVHGKWLAHIHVAEKEGRFAPGTSGEDFGPYLNALKKIAYKGAISYECGWKDLPSQSATSVKSFRKQIQQAGLM